MDQMKRRPTHAASRKKKTARKVGKKTTKQGPQTKRSAAVKKTTATARKKSTTKKAGRKKVTKKKTSSAKAPASPAPQGSRGVVGALGKMKTEHQTPVQYFLPVGDADPIPLNDAVGRTITIEYQNRIECVHCGRKTNKSFNQGYCFPCLRKLAQCDSCIIKPELCHHHEGTCREPDWAERNCFQPHVVYIANTSGLKVGITRGTQIPTRWIDQGAHRATPMFVARDRRMSGLVEVAIKQQVADRTDFRRMLKGDPEARDMRESVLELRAEASAAIEEIRRQHGDDAVVDAADEDVREFDYPVNEWPEKVRSVTLDKEPIVRDVLTGIKGQYLMFGNVVFNVRRHSGYIVSVSIE